MIFFLQNQIYRIGKCNHETVKNIHQMPDGQQNTTDYAHGNRQPLNHRKSVFQEDIRQNRCDDGAEHIRQCGSVYTDVVHHINKQIPVNSQ